MNDNAPDPTVLRQSSREIASDVMTLAVDLSTRHDAGLVVSNLLVCTLMLASRVGIPPDICRELLEHTLRAFEEAERAMVRH